MWCKSCNMETRDEVCPICGQPTYEDIPTEINWCKKCRVPIIQEPKQADKGYCPLCGGKTKYLAVDLRPVFPEERLLVEILLNKPVNDLAHASVWAEANRYYIDGKSTPLPLKMFAEADTDKIAKELEQRQPANDASFFFETINRFITANKHHLNAMEEEAYEFVRRTAARFPRENVVISFSGGKDSTATADVVLKALSEPSIVHIFGDTTLEFPSTVEYAKRYRDNHPNAIFLVARNEEQDFSKVIFYGLRWDMDLVKEHILSTPMQQLKPEWYWLVV